MRLQSILFIIIAHGASVRIFLWRTGGTINFIYGIFLNNVMQIRGAAQVKQQNAIEFHVECRCRYHIFQRNDPQTKILYMLLTEAMK